MITTRTPLRITLGGGGSDLETGQGICLAATIDKYVTVTVSESWDDDYLLHYSQTERVRHVDEIRHRIIRDVFKALDVPPGIQVSSHADVPAGTGLGNSGAFTVGLLKALRPEWSRRQLADMAVELDIGQQDQWSAVFGGTNVYDFDAGTIFPVETALEFELYYTGIKRDAAEILTGPPKPVTVAREQVREMVDGLENDDAGFVGALLHEQWLAKYKESPTPEHDAIDAWIQEGRMNGASGGKLVGAGGGGFILFLGEPAGLYGRRLSIALTHEGSRCL